jgi:hypothetical protein
LKRAECLAVVADGWAELAARLDDVQRAEERGVRRGLGGKSEGEDEESGFHDKKKVRLSFFGAFD